MPRAVLTFGGSMQAKKSASTAHRAAPPVAAGWCSRGGKASTSALTSPHQLPHSASAAAFMPERPAVLLLQQQRSSRHTRRKLHKQCHLRALFTGIVQGTASVLEVSSLQDFRKLQIQLPHLEGVQIGASIAINGVCLTVTAADPAQSSVSFDVIQETLRRTNLGTLANGSTVNFERSARMGDEIGGHNVAGHIHSTAEIVSLEETPNNLRMVFQVPPEWMKYILPKGFIAVDGISLTVGEVTHDTFCVYLIPETLRATNLGTRRVGEHANIEIEQQTQTIVDTVERYLARHLQLPGQHNGSAQPAAALHG